MPIFRLVDSSVTTVHIATSAVINIGNVERNYLLWADWGVDQVLAIARAYINIEDESGHATIYAHVTVL